MTDKQFNTIYDDACSRSDEEAYISSWLSEDHRLKEQQLRKIWQAAHITMAEIRATTGLSQAKFAERLHVPWRTVQDWEYREKYPAYVKLLIIRNLKILDI